MSKKAVEQIYRLIALVKELEHRVARDPDLHHTIKELHEAKRQLSEASKAAGSSRKPRSAA